MQLFGFPLTSALSINRLLIAGGLNLQNLVQNQVLVFNTETGKVEKTWENNFAMIASSQGCLTHDGSAVGLV